MQPYPTQPGMQYPPQMPDMNMQQMTTMRQQMAGRGQPGSNVLPQAQMPQHQLKMQQQHAQMQQHQLQVQQQLLQSQPPLPSLSPASLPQKEAHTTERHTISEDRSAGSNMEVRNLAALKDRNVSQKSSEPMGHPGLPGFAHVRPSSSQSPREYAQFQQRFGRLRLDEEYPDENIEERDQSNLNDGLLPADVSASLDNSQPQLVAKDDWVEDFEQADTSSSLQVDIDALQRHITEMQKQLSELEIQKQLHADKQFQILYRIEGTSYFDHPEWTQGYRSVVSRIPVRNLDLFLERNKNVIFIVYRDFNLAPPKTAAKHKPSSPQHTRESIHPVSRQLRKTLEMMLKHDWRYKSMFLEFRRKREMDAPYLFIYHHRTYWKDILAHCPYSVREHLNLVATYVSKNYGKEYMAADALFAGRKVSAEYIQYLFQPGDILISRSAGQYRGLVARSWPQDSGHVHRHPQPPMHQPNSSVDSDINSDSALDSSSSSDVDISDNKMKSSVEAVEHERDLLQHFFRRIRPGTASKAENNNKPVSTESSDKQFEVKIWQWSFDGDFKRVEGNIMLRLSQSTDNDPSRAKEWNMHDLDVYPLKFAPQSLVQKLRRRGMMFWKCRKRCLVSYHETNADAQDEVRRFPSNETLFEEYMLTFAKTDERFMIDFPTFRKLHSENKSYVIHISVDTMTQAEMEQEEPPDKAFYYLVPLQTKGFNLRTKKWLDLNMDQIGPVVWNEKAFDSLVLDKDKKTKELITALVSKQIASSKSTDVVAGKGNGLILLLHGGPGTGKTLTAEGVAEIAKKPLYRVSGPCEFS